MLSGTKGVSVQVSGLSDSPSWHPWPRPNLVWIWKIGQYWDLLQRTVRIRHIAPGRADTRHLPSEFRWKFINARRQPTTANYTPNPDKPELKIDDWRLKICGFASLCLFYFIRLSRKLQWKKFWNRFDIPLGLIQFNFSRLYGQLYNIQEFFSTSDPVPYLPTGAFWITGLF